MRNFTIYSSKKKTLEFTFGTNAIVFYRLIYVLLCFFTYLKLIAFVYRRRAQYVFIVKNTREEIKKNVFYHLF